MKLSSFRYAGPQAIKSIRNNGWLSVAALLTITIALFLCTFFWLLLINIDANARQVEEDITIAVYLDYDIALDEQVENLTQEIGWLGGVESVTFVPKEQGLAMLQERFGSVDLLSTMEGSNPLPDMLSVTAQSSEYVAGIAEQIEGLDGVDLVRYGEGTVEKLFTLVSTMRKAGVVIMIMLAVAAVVLIAMAVRLTIVSRRKEIMVMKWVGSTNAFIRWPFFLEGMILGLAGAVVALGLTLLIYTQAGDYLAGMLSFITILPLSAVWGEITLFCLGAGIVLGAIGSLLPLAKFLDV